MANYRTEWQAIADRIEGLLQATEVIQRLCPGHTDPKGAYCTDILPHAQDLFRSLETYCQNHASALPQAANAALDAFLTGHRESFEPKGPVEDKHARELAKRTVPALALIRAEVNCLLSDPQALLMRITERAFVHLQRSIIADYEIRRKWAGAFHDQHEPYIERLGAVHLLSHGIWAFKAHSEGERTDLVLSQPLTDLDQVAATAEGLVLTEWKKVTDPKALGADAEQAYLQASRYARSALAGFELADRRYLVLVSEGDLTDQLPEDRNDQRGITYRHINIAVNPPTPSRL